MTPTEEQVKHIKTQYQAYLHTEAGKADLAEAMRILKQWRQEAKEFPDSFNSKCVKRDNLPNQIADKMQCIEITPICLNNLCHTNARLLKTFGFGSRLGYNVMSCPCGKAHCFELHTVNQAKDTLIDFTRDFAGETRKWFFPISTSLDASTFVRLFGDRNSFIRTDSGCECFGWVESGEGGKWDMDGFQKFIEIVGKVVMRTPLKI